jgi:hypothetical protein
MTRFPPLTVRALRRWLDTAPADAIVLIDCLDAYRIARVQHANADVTALSPDDEGGARYACAPLTGQTGLKAIVFSPEVAPGSRVRYPEP